jgi:hypothetical protein
MSTELERNIASLVLHGVLRPRPAEAKARFLGAAAPQARPRFAPLALAAAALLAATLAAVVGRRDPAYTTSDRKHGPAQDSSWAVLRPLTDDAAVSLKARLPVPGARVPLLRLEGSADLPDRFLLFVSVQREREAYDGRRLRADAALVHGGFVQVARGRIALDLRWTDPAPFRVQARLSEADQGPEIQAAMRGKYPVREWLFQGAGWGDGLMGRLPAAGEEIDAAAADLAALLKKAEAACATRERWLREAPALRPELRALRERLEQLPARMLLSAAGDLLLSTARNLDGDSAYFDWTGDDFQGPVSYHADRQKMKTYRAEAWSFAALRRYAEEATAVADRELGLWIVKDIRRGGPRPEHASIAKRPGLARHRERLAAATDVDALEDELRAGR